MNRLPLQGVLSAALFALALPALAASPVAFKRDESDTANELVLVTCSDGRTGHVVKKAGTKEFCTGKDGSGGYCSISKVKAAAEVCK